ncbi:DUF6622 family protein [Comamonas sp.]|uniref:DUF6622 family protein n=1 Tax=Comamonas sp. TaxID=34028 RepID=UPI0035D92049
MNTSGKDAPVLIDILTHTPAWVFLIFGLLLFLGSMQLRPSSPHLVRAIALPLAMVALAIYGVMAAFGQSPAGLSALLVWALVAIALAVLVGRIRLHEAVLFDPVRRRFALPGSAVPLVLMMGIFATKYAVGVMLALHPGYAHESGFALGASALYGVFSGVFAGRALRLMRLAMRGQAMA